MSRTEPCPLLLNRRTLLSNAMRLAAVGAGIPFLSSAAAALQAPSQTPAAGGQAQPSGTLLVLSADQTIYQFRASEIAQSQ